MTAQTAEKQRLILVADDEHAVRRLLQRTLERTPYCVATAADGEETLRLAREQHPDVILLDAELPTVHGFDVCRQLKQDPRTQDILILIVTAKAQEVDRMRGLEAGADGYITTPFSPRALIEQLQSTLGTAS